MSFDSRASRKQPVRGTTDGSLWPWAIAAGAGVLLLGVVFARFVDTDSPVSSDAVPVADSAKTHPKDNWLNRGWNSGTSNVPGGQGAAPGYGSLFLPPEYNDKGTTDTNTDAWRKTASPGQSMRARWQRFSAKPAPAARAGGAAQPYSAPHSAPERQDEDAPLWVWGDEYEFDQWWDAPDEDEAPETEPESDEDREFEAWWASDE